MKYIIKSADYAIFFPLFRKPMRKINGKVLTFNNKKSVNKYMKDNFLFNGFLGYYSKAYPYSEVSA